MYPYTTSTVSAETQIEGEKFENDILAFGIHAITDKSNNGGLRNSSFAGTIAFHKVLDEQNFSRLGIGLQVAYTSKVVDFSKMSFETQFTPTGFDVSLPTNELTNGFALNYLDYSAGLMYSYLSGDINFYGGGAISHLSRPRETYGSISERIPMRYTLNAGASVLLRNNNTLYGSLMHLRTSQSNQTTVGVIYGFNLNGLEDNEANEFLLGSWLRLNDAVVPYIGLKIGNVHGGISYDFTTSNVTVANKGMGGFELTMQVLLDKNSNKETIRKMKCKFIMY
jgi:type IX secretion system PorP/SprF family membrane protein